MADHVELSVVRIGGVGPIPKTDVYQLHLAVRQGLESALSNLTLTFRTTEAATLLSLMLSSPPKA